MAEGDWRRGGWWLGGVLHGAPASRFPNVLCASYCLFRNISLQYRGHKDSSSSGGNLKTLCFHALAGLWYWINRMSGDVCAILCSTQAYFSVMRFHIQQKQRTECLYICMIAVAHNGLNQNQFETHNWNFKKQLLRTDGTKFAVFNFFHRSAQWQVRKYTQLAALDRFNASSLTRHLWLFNIIERQFRSFSFLSWRRMAGIAAAMTMIAVISINHDEPKKSEHTVCPRCRICETGSHWPESKCPAWDLAGQRALIKEVRRKQSCDVKRIFVIARYPTAFWRRLANELQWDYGTVSYRGGCWRQPSCH